MSKLLLKSMAAVALAGVTGSATANQAESFKAADIAAEHLVKAQYYRWFQLYERELTKPRIANQLDIFTEDIYIKSVVGERTGKPAYVEAIALYEGWKNAHHVKRMNITQVDGGYRLQATIDYQGIKPNGELSAYEVTYDANLRNGAERLPKFSKIVITPTVAQGNSYSDAYLDNRAKSLMHYWLGLIEKLDGNIEPFKEILADKFEINFPSTKVDSLEKLEAWANGIPTHVELSTHYIENLSVKPLGDNRFQLYVEFDWYGIMKDGSKMRYRTAHNWEVVDHINKRFAKIVKIDVKELEPLRKVD
ncbi:hypothetical protein P7F88_08905 [Vibrio hannami]|uniref:hypothetical protein n=1 Tax=Vibrio hannami TaxID=2717094 RepID=UPI00240F74B1|nr:hypothetical protein [Vibrio hannami]MDG3086216.1 hypothetical protein [Vibrio hannami]